MKQLLLSFTLLFCITVYGQSPNDHKKEKIVYLFSLMKQDSLINKTFELISSSIATQMKNAFNDTNYAVAGINVSDMSARITERSIQTAKESAKRLLDEDMVGIYDKYFTMTDIENFISFYQSKSGQKMIDRLPDITKDVMSAMTTKYQPALQQSIMKVMEELMKESSKQ